MRRLIFVLVLLLLVVSCQPRQGLEHVKYSGTEGLVVKFTENSPPETVYEATAFPVKVEISNMGATNSRYDEMIVTFSSDPLYILGRYDYPANILDQDPDNDMLYGRSLSYPVGESRMFSVPSDSAFMVKPVYGQRESPTTQMTSSLCFQYNTIVAADVCVDTNIYSVNEREQSCIEHDLTLSGGQGAPIAVSKIEVSSYPVVDTTIGRESIRPHFLIYIEDVGSGRLIGHDGLEMSSACFLKDIPKEEVNTVRIDASLLGTKLECKPSEFIRLYGGKGEAQCTVPSNDLNNPVYSSTQNFQTVLMINLSYIYKVSDTADITVKRIPGTDRPELPLVDIYIDGKLKGYMYKADEIVRDDWGRAYTECRYYGENPDEAPDPLKGKIDASWNCACSLERCKILKGTGRCIGGYCPANVECCTDQLPGRTSYEFSTPAPNPSVNVPSIGSSPSKTQVNSALEAAAAKYGIDPDILKGMAYQESRWGELPVGDGGKAHGIMHVHQDYHPNYDVAEGKRELSYNIEYATSYLLSLYQRHGDWNLAIRAYNGRIDNDETEAYLNLIKKHAREKPWMKWL